MGQFSVKNPCRPGQFSVEINTGATPQRQRSVIMQLQAEIARCRKLLAGYRRKNRFHCDGAPLPHTGRGRNTVSGEAAHRGGSTAVRMVYGSSRILCRHRAL
jgi:hypothetical protein